MVTDFEHFVGVHLAAARRFERHLLKDKLRIFMDKALLASVMDGSALASWCDGCNARE